MIDHIIRRESSTPKCMNCHRWTRLPQTDALGTCALGGHVVEDIAICSAWERAQDPVIEVRKVGETK